MNMVRAACRVLACIVCILLAPPGWGGEAGRGDIEALIESGRFEEALVLLPTPGQGEPAGPETLFLYGLAAIGASQRPDLSDGEQVALLDAAIAALRTMLIDNPALVRVRLEMARAFFLKGEDALARRHFERVLAGNPPPNVAANIVRFLAEMRARKRWNFNLGAALAPDSNISSASDERTIYYVGPPFPRDADDLPTSGVGLALWGGAEYQHPLGRGLRLRAGADAALRDYKGSRFDNLSVSGHLGPRWLLDARTEASLLASARRSWVEGLPGVSGLPQSREIGARLELGYRVSPRVTAFAQASWHHRRYRSQRDSDGPVLDGSVNLGWTVAPTVRADFYGGYGKERPLLLRYRNRSLRLGAAISVALPRGFTLGGGGEIRWTGFRGIWWPPTRDGLSRRDRALSLRASVHNRGFTVHGFSPELVLAQEARISNAQFQDYKRIRGELRFVRQF